MGKIALIANVGENDHWQHGDIASYQKMASISFAKFQNVRDVSIHEFLDALKKLKLEPTELAMDLLIISCTMYAADTRIEREKYADDSWTRIIDLYVPVSDTGFWDSQKLLLQKIFRFLTGDIWSIFFRPRSDQNLLLSPKGRYKKHRMTYQTNTVCLFSGGMDSFIGTIDLLEQGIRPLLVSHSKSSDVSPYQDKCYNSLAQNYPAILPAKIYGLVRIPKIGQFGEKDSTERGRSFMFLTLGGISASCLSAENTLVVPENGMISLNIPLTPLRIGSHSTRTTHPHYFQMMQILFDNMRLGVTIRNPYQFKTKGEMLDQCPNKNLAASTETMSCSHPSGQWYGQSNMHCGYCVPCIIRRAAYKAAQLTDNFPYRTDIFDPQGISISRAEGADVYAFMYLIEKVEAKPDFLTALTRSTGPLGSNVDNFVNVYGRSLLEVKNLLTGIVLR